MDKLRCAVLGASGVVGQEFVRMLESHPRFEVAALTASERSSGKRFGDVRQFHTFSYDLREMKLTDTSPAEFRKDTITVAFSALPADAAKGIEMELAKSGVAVFSNASTYRMEPDVPLLVPEVNLPHLALVDAQRKARNMKGFIVTNPNCTTTGLVMALKPLADAFRLKRVTMASYQALSGAGYPGVASLDIVGNVLPFIRNEEEKVEVETVKLLGTPAKGGVAPHPASVEALCARVAVRNGHLEAVSVELEKEPAMGEVVSAMDAFNPLEGMKLPTAPLRPLLLRREEDRPQPLLDVDAGEPARARGMAVTVGRLRLIGRNLRFFLLSNNLVRGAAGCSILNAEAAAERGLL